MGNAKTLPEAEIDVFNESEKGTVGGINLFGA